jgi:CO/xanthine dehydrogenase FAD-binding subunit
MTLLSCLVGHLSRHGVSLMIVEYHRPKLLEEALALLARAEPITLPLGGGSALNRPSPQPLAVVDLQALDLNFIRQKANTLVLGATLTLEVFQKSLDQHRASHSDLVAALQKAINHEATYNLRQVATVAGTLVAADGRSPFAAVMLALDAQLTIQPGEKSPAVAQEIKLGDILPLRSERLRGRLITQVTIPMNARLAYEYVARSPADRPIVCALVTVWPSGRTRVVLGGHGGAPVLAFDGADSEGAEIAARSAYSQAGDEWASAEYRQDMADVLTRRCLH